MQALKYSKIIEKDGEIKITGIPCKKGQQVEMILLLESTNEPQENHKAMKFNAIKLKTSNFKFNREIANER